MLRNKDILLYWLRRFNSIFFLYLLQMLARLMPREIDADVNAGYSLMECLREMEERSDKIGE